MLSETGRLIEQSAERIFAEHCSPTQLKAAEGGWSGELWSALTAAGLPQALEPGGEGDFALPVGDALNLFRVAGRHVAPVPLVETMLANWLLRRSGLAAADDPLSIAGLHPRDSLSLERTSQGWRLTGEARHVPWGRCADLLAVAETANGTFIVQVPRGSFEILEQENPAREPRDTAHFEANLPGGAAAPCPVRRDHLRVQAAAARAFQIAGALERVLEMTVRYAGERVQFGRAIGKFQAIQQTIAIMGGQAAAVRAAVNAAAPVFEADDSFHVLAAAKIRAGEAAGLVARHAHQVHGAIGFTQDYPLHFLTKRLWSWRDEFGNEAYWSRKLGEEACRRGGDQVWGFITSGLSSRAREEA